MTDYCERCDLPASMCQHSRKVDPLPASSDLGPWFTAQFPGRCSTGEETIQPGDRIRADGEGGYLCRRCGRDDQ